MFVPVKHGSLAECHFFNAKEAFFIRTWYDAPKEIFSSNDQILRLGQMEIFSST